MSIIYGSPLFLSSSSQNADLPPLLDNFKAYAGTTPPEPETITLADIPVSDAETETIVNLKESDGKLHPYLYLSNNHNNTNGALLLRKNIGTVKGVWTVWNQPDNSQYYRYWCEKEFFTTILDPSVSSQAISGNIKAHFTSNSDVTLGTTKCFALSLVEYGLPASGGDEGPQLPYFSSNSRRIAYNDSGAATEHYTRSSVTATGFYIDTSGTNKSDYTPVNTPRGLRPAIFLPFSFKLIATANEDGSYDMYEGQAVQTLAETDGIITIAADKMEESRAKELAGAVWVYGDHIPKNVNDGTKIQLTRDEIVKPDSEPYLTLNDIPASDAKTETIVNLKESDGQLYPYLYLVKDYEGSKAGLLLRKDISQLGNIDNLSGNKYQGNSLDTWCTNTFINNLDQTVQNALVAVDIASTSGTKINRKCFAISDSEYGGNHLIEGNNIPYFDSNSKRIAMYNNNAYDHWTRSSFPSAGSTAYFIQETGEISSNISTQKGYRPAICLTLLFKIKATPNIDGSYDMYEEQNSYKLTSYDTSDISDKPLESLPSGSRIKLGALKGTPLQWKLCRDTVTKELRLVLERTSVTLLGKKSFDAAEPSNPISERRVSGNNRYLYSNLHQWLNSDKGANEWYTSSHTYDAPPTYQNEDGFLMEWSDLEKSVLNTNEWKTINTTVDGGGEDIVRAKVAVLSIGEIGGDGVKDGNKLDIFNSDGDRSVGSDCWTRSVAASNPSAAWYVNPTGVMGSTDIKCSGSYSVRTVCAPNKYTMISSNVDSDGCYVVTRISGKVEKQVSWEKTKDFHVRQFTYNSKKQYQTMLEGAVASVIVEGAPANVTDFQITGSGASLVLSWVNPIDDELYQETVVIQKQDSEPTDITDGTEIYRGTDETCTATGLEQSTDYYFAIYTVSSLGVYKQPVVKSYRFDFPDKPGDDEYTEITTITGQNGEYEIPEDGWFKVILSGEAGAGGDTGGHSWKGTYISFDTGAGGGSSGYCISIFKFNKGEKIPYTLIGNAAFKDMSVTAAGDGADRDGKGGNPGIASGGTIENKNGNIGQVGTGTSLTRPNASNGQSRTSPRNPGGASSGPYSQAGGGSGTKTITYYNDYEYNNGFMVTSSSPEKRKPAYLKIFRGNTNIPSPSHASVLSLIPKNNSVDAIWENSGDPVQTGTMLVYNTSHTPKSPSDGVVIDVPLTQPVTLALNSDSEELQEDSKKQSYTITGVPNDKPVFVALFPYDKDRKYGLAKQEVEIPREHSWYDKQQELESEVETVKAEMADYQSYYTTTQEVLK